MGELPACFSTMPTNKTPMWLLERAAQGELDALEVEELRSRLAAEGRALEDELEKLRQSDRHILARLPRSEMGAAIRRRAAAGQEREERARFGTRWLAPLALAGTVGLVLLVARRADHGDAAAPTASRPVEDEVTVIKGDPARSPRLLVYRQRSGRASTADSELLANGARASRGDLLQLAYDKAPEGLFGVLVSVDGSGMVTQHMPEKGAAQAAPLTSLRELRLPSSYELDDAPGFERFILVTAAQPFPIAAVLDAAHALVQRGTAARGQPLPLAQSYEQVSIVLNKTRETP